MSESQTKEATVTKVNVGFNIEGLRVLRAERGLTMTQMGNDCGVMPCAISRYEHGKKASVPTMKKVADYFGITIEQLIAYNKKLKKNGGDWE